MKDKKVIILIAVITVLFAGLIYLKVTQKKPTDWTPTFINTKTDPYGTYINYKLLKEIFDNRIVTTRKPIYNNLKGDLENYFTYQNEENYDYSEYTDNDAETYDEYSDSTSYEEQSVVYAQEDTVPFDPMSIYNDKEIPDTTAYIFINKKFELDKLDLEYLLDFAGLGNNVFISAESFSSLLMDTLGIKAKEVFFDTDTTYTLTDFPTKKYRFGALYNTTKFSTDSCRFPIRVLATNGKNDTTFIQVKYGHGNFYLHSVPTAFANINLLKTEKYDFAFRSLSYIPRNNKIIWDEYQKQGEPNQLNMFRVMLDSLPLRIALYLIFFGFLLFIIFRAKRTQRIIPIIKPPVNSSLEFLDTISNLYYRKKDFETIVQKRHAFFLDYLRKNYYMSTEHVDNEFINVLSSKSGVEKDKLMRVFTLYKEITASGDISNSMFLEYNSLLEEFYRNAKNK